MFSCTAVSAWLDLVCTAVVAEKIEQPNGGRIFYLMQVIMIWDEDQIQMLAEKGPSS